MHTSNKLKTSLDYAKLACDTFLRNIEAEKLPPEGRFHYHAGVFLLGMQRTYELSGEEKYYEYVKRWVDSNIEPDGKINSHYDDGLDDMQAGNLLFMLYEKTGDERYKIALETLVTQLKTWPRNKKGGFWHKGYTNHQMWLDGIYMAGPIAVHYASVFGDEWYYGEVYKQLKLMAKYMRDSKTGLYKHGWDCEKVQPWADPVTGLSEEFWGRAIGWYVAALLDIADYMPQKYKEDIVKIDIDLIKSLIKHQDKETGLWYQVVDKGHLEDNWHEVSCSALFTYGICKGIRLGYLDEEYKKYAEKAYKGIIETVDFAENGDLLIQKVCIGTGVDKYDYYVNRPVSTNDLHGAGTFLLMCTEYHRLFGSSC